MSRLPWSYTYSFHCYLFLDLHRLQKNWDYFVTAVPFHFHLAEWGLYFQEVILLQLVYVELFHSISIIFTIDWLNILNSFFTFLYIFLVMFLQVYLFTCPAKRKCLTFCLVSSSLWLTDWKCFNHVPYSDASKKPRIPAAGTKTWKGKYFCHFFEEFRKRKKFFSKFHHHIMPFMRIWFNFLEERRFLS